MSGEILYHNSVSVIVPGFTTLIEDFVIHCIRAPIFTARGLDPSLRLLQGTLVSLVLERTSQFRSSGK